VSKKFSIIDRFKSFKYAFAGLGSSFSTEHNLWLHLIAATIVCSGGFYFCITTTEWSVLLMIIGLVIASELFNTAIEKLADYACKGEYNDQIKKVKDTSAGAVLVLALVAVVIGGLIFVPYIVKWV
jgi:diacylglycerol kinase